MSRTVLGQLPDMKDTAPEDGVSVILNHAVANAASDLFFSGTINRVLISVRRFGIVETIGELSLESGRRYLTYIKAAAGMDIAERRRPQDGRWIHSLAEGRLVDLRINTIPTMYGEDFAIRILARDTELRSIDQLGMAQHEYNLLIEMLNRPSGLVLVTGPTGSGKTTTLYACLSRLNDGQRKLHTIEDPIEYALDGLHQSQVNPAIDLDFPELLRSILRQSPDVIMIGEIRDEVTAKTTVRAANSGHLVFATLPSPVAAMAIQGVLSLGVHPHFLSTSLLGVISQRLVRTLCPKCKVTYDVSTAPHTFDAVRKWLKADEGKVLCGPKGCDACEGTGYVGRAGVFEVMAVTQEIRRLIAEDRPAREVRDKAVEQGMREFRHSALLKVAWGETSTEEVFRVIPTEYLLMND
ncbi:MAG: type II/IV secretion system protein [Phycisphaerae bacterium]|nr:type II/IV secretion system protein [Phycisphaerae bacterium]